MAARTASPARAQVAAALLLLLLLGAWLLASAPSAAAQQRPPTACRCSCSSRVVRLLTCSRDTPCCVVPCERASPVDGSLLSDNPNTQRALAAARAAAQACTNDSLSRDAQLESRHTVAPGTPEYHHGVGDQPVGVEGYRRSAADRCLAYSVAGAVASANNVSKRDVASQVLALRVNNSLPNPWASPQCNASARYRTRDGSCNNLAFPAWGQAGRPFLRLLCPSYADGLYAAPRARDGRPLPSARLLRTVLIPDAPRAHYTNGFAYSLLVMQWGQLVAHDTAFTFDTMGVNGFAAQCCAINNSTPSHRAPLPANETTSYCLPVNGPGPYCLSVVRGNATFVTDEGVVGPAEQDNVVNSYLDASFVYGSDDTTLAPREFQGGRLNTSGNNWLPFTPAANCDPRGNSSVCFVAGDGRVNQNSQLTSLQIVFLREHNRVAAQLAQVNPQWADERIFQEARRIVGAVWQHITYSRLVPIYLGPLTAKKFDLLPEDDCQFNSNGYMPDVESTTLNEFTTASYRVFHGIAQSVLKLFSEAGGCPMFQLRRCPAAKLNINDWMDTPEAVVQPPERLDQLLLGLSTQAIQKPARWMPEALGEHMFQTDRDPGQDLGAIDVQRNRDHGLCSYCSYKRKLGGRCCTSWRDLEEHIDPEIVQRMSKIYSDPRDVDLYVGLFLERPNGFALTGPSSVAINAEQFFRFKFGDRFFYEFSGQAGSFTQAQLCEIKKVTAARLFCDNGDNIMSIQRDVFLQPCFTNPVVNCRDIPALNFSAWRE